MTFSYPKVLVVDHSLENLVAMKKVLSKLRTIILNAESYDEAISLTLRHDFAVILLDAQMPEMDIYEITALLHENKKTQNTPIIFITAEAIEESPVFRGYKSGEIDFLTKPINDFILRSKVAVFLELFAKGESLKKTNKKLKKTIEELKRSQQCQLELNRQLEKSNVKAIQLAKQTQSASKAKSEFMANMSHELRTPLNAILILSEVLGENKERRLSEKECDFVETIKSSGSALLHIINDILDFTKLDSGKTTFTLREVNIESFVQDLEESVLPTVKDNGLTFTTQLDSGLPVRFCTDEKKIRQILNNLFSNAIKFSNGGKIRFRVFGFDSLSELSNCGLGHKSAIAFAVSDEGIGIPEDDYELIFGAFTMSDGTSTRMQGGAGLGLSISRKYAQKLGGELLLESTVGKGSTFTLYLPLEEAVDITLEPPI